MKKLTLVLFTLLTLLPLGSWAESITIIEGVTYDYTETTATVISIENNKTEAVIPAQITITSASTFDVTGISATLNGCTNLQTLTIGKNVATIPEGSFKNCSNLTSFSVADDNTNFKVIDGVLFSKDEKTLISFPAKKDGDSYSIPSTVTTIYNYAFSGCSNLKSLTVGENVSAIPHYMFENCSGLQTLTIKNTSLLSGSSINSALSQLPSDICIISAGIKYYHHGEWNSANDYFSVGDGTNSTGFDDNTKSGNSLNVLASIGTDTPIPVTTIADNAFYGTASGFSISLPNSITSISALSFASNNLKSFSVADGNAYFKAIGGVLFSNDGKTLISFPTKKDGNSYSIPSTVTTIYDNAFSGCSNLKSLTVGENVTTIPDDVFKDCSGLQTLVFKNTKLDVQNLSFNFTQSQVNPALCIIVDGVKYYHKGEWSDANHYFAVSNGSNGWGFDAATASGNQLTVLGKVCKINVTTISNNAFYSVAAGYSISLPSSITTISNASFIRNMLKAINVDENNQTYKSIDGVLFSKDEKTLVSFPSKKGNTYLIPDEVTTIGGDAFNAHSDMTSVTIPASVTTIGQSAFQYTGKNSSFTVTFSGTSQLKTIERSAFQESGLSSITLLQGITTIGDQAFRNCQKLQSINLPSSLTSIGEHAFNQCKGLQSVTFADSYSNLTIGGSAFYNCKLTNTIILPNGVTTIGGNAFNREDGFGDSQLTKIYLPASAEFSSNIVNSYVKIYRKVNMNVSGSWSTYYSNINLALPTGWKAYTVTGVSGNNVTTTELSYIHQQKAVLLQLGTMPADGYFEVPDNATIELDKNIVFKPELFIGTSKPINNFSSLEGDKYVLTDDGNFVKSNQGTLPAFRCYIKLNSNNNTTLYVKDSNADPNTFIFFEEGTQIDTSKKNLGSVSISSGTLTVTPANGYYINQSDITVKRNVSAGNGRAPAIDNNPITLVPTVDDADPSGVTTYTFTTTAGSTYEVSVNFHKRKSLSDNNIKRDIEFTDKGYVYDGKAKTPEISAVKFDGSVVNSKNYTVSYTNNINAGSATIVVTGKREFMNAYSKTFKIGKRNFDYVTVKSIPDHAYTGSPVEPVNLVLEDIVDGKNIASVTDCNFVYKNNNVEIGTVTFFIQPKNNYDGSDKGPFTFNIVAGTAIEKISVEELEEGQWFTLSGHPLVNKPTQKGVYIFRDKNRKAMKIRIK